MKGSIPAAAFDDPMMQGIMAIRQAADLDSSAPKTNNTGLQIVVLRHGDDNLKTLRLSPADCFSTLM